MYGVASELTELQFSLDGINSTTNCATTDAEPGSGLQFDTYSSGDEIAVCVDFFFGASDSDSFNPGLAVEEPLAIREPFAFDDSTSAEELSRRDGIIALYEAEVRAAGSATRIPRPPRVSPPSRRACTTRMAAIVQAQAQDCEPASSP